jgi:NADPH:quinone reductase-like Zn-dependent oxidoreductase/3-oxoacyl-(acyl-carrier-protein) synthase/acyl carrier protein
MLRQLHEISATRKTAREEHYGSIPDATFQLLDKNLHPCNYEDTPHVHLYELSLDEDLCCYFFGVPSFSSASMVLSNIFLAELLIACNCKSLSGGYDYDLSLFHWRFDNAITFANSDFYQAKTQQLLFVLGDDNSFLVCGINQFGMKMKYCYGFLESKDPISRSSTPPSTPNKQFDEAHRENMEDKAELESSEASKYEIRVNLETLEDQQQSQSSSPSFSSHVSITKLCSRLLQAVFQKCNEGVLSMKSSVGLSVTLMDTMDRSFVDDFRYESFDFNGKHWKNFLSSKSSRLVCRYEFRFDDNQASDCTLEFSIYDEQNNFILSIRGFKAKKFISSSQFNLLLGNTLVQKHYVLEHSEWKTLGKILFEDNPLYSTVVNKVVSTDTGSIYTTFMSDSNTYTSLKTAFPNFIVRNLFDLELDIENGKAKLDKILILVDFNALNCGVEHQNNSQLFQVSKLVMLAAISTSHLTIGIPADLEKTFNNLYHRGFFEAMHRSAKVVCARASLLYYESKFIASLLKGFKYVYQTEPTKEDITAIEDSMLNVYSKGVFSISRHRPSSQAHRNFVLVECFSRKGLIMAKVLCQLGASNICLVSQSGTAISDFPNLVDDLEWLENQESKGKARIHFMQFDVSKEESVKEMLGEVRRRVGKIDGIVHGAGVLTNSSIKGDATAMGFEDLWRVKALSAWWLHLYTKEDDLKYFIAFSSPTAEFDNIAQAACSAAKCFLVSLLHERKKTGLPSLCVTMSSAFVGSLADFYVLSCCFSTKPLPSSLFLSSVARDLLEQDSVKESSSLSFNDSAKVIEAVRVEVLNLIHTSECDNTKPLVDMGLDSFGATDLTIKLSKKFNMAIPPTLVFNYPTVEKISSYILEELQSNVLFEDSDVTEKKANVNVHSRVVCDDTSIVLTGISCRLPGNIRSLTDFQQTLENSVVHCGEVSSKRWDSDAIIASLADVADTERLDSIRYGAFLTDEDFQDFDGSVFGISEAEALHMDPAQKFLLQTTLEAIKDAGYDVSMLGNKKVGVFVAASGSLGESSFPLQGFRINQFSDDKQQIHNDAHLSVYDATAKTLSVAAGRISYTFGFQGPCMTVDTACSSSLVALHNARRSLQHNECDMAIVAGVNIIHPSASLACAVAGMLSPEGKCNTFDESANGYCRGEGCCAIVLERREKGENVGDNNSDKEHVYAVIRGSAVMQDGRSANLTAPNGLAQEMLIREALMDAGIDGNEVTYVEAHGTGTKLGDPVEAEALIHAYCQNRDASCPLYVGGVKANVGHLEAGAGMAGLLSLICVLSKRRVYGNARLRSLNPRIAELNESGSITFPEMSMDIEGKDRVFASLSSFGYQGTIAHLVFESSKVFTSVPSIIHNEASYRSTPSFPAFSSLAHRFLSNSASSVVSTYITDSTVSSWLGDHMISGSVVFPGAGYIELALCVENLASESRNISLEGFTIESMLTLDQFSINSGVSLQTVRDEVGNISVSSVTGGGDKISHFSGVSNPAALVSEDEKAQLENRMKLLYHSCVEEVNIDLLYDTFSAAGLSYGETFKILQSVKKSGNIVGAVINSSISIKGSYFMCSPCLLDAALQSTLGFSDLSVDSPYRPLVPYAFDKIMYFGEVRPNFNTSDICFSVVISRKSDSKTAIFDLAVLSSDWKLLLYCENCYARLMINSSVVESAFPIEKCFRSYEPFDLPFFGNAKSLKIVVSCDPSTDFHALEFLSGHSLFSLSEGLQSGMGLFDVGLVFISSSYCTVDVPGESDAILMIFLKQLDVLLKLTNKILVLSFVDPKLSKVSTLLQETICSELLTLEIENPKVMFCSLSVFCEVSQFSSSQKILLDEMLISFKAGEYQMRDGNLFKSGRRKCTEASLTNLEMFSRGSVNNLVLGEVSWFTLRSNEIGVVVHSVALNFRDVLNVLGMYPGDPGAPGCEFAGRVVAVGEEVTHFKVGDEVLGIGSGCLTEYYIADEKLSGLKPKCITMEEASTVPIVYSTVFHALGELAELKKGETVLIHSAAGGVGLSAIQYAQRVGARIIATASEGKHEYLKKLGVEYITSSRDAEVFLKDLKEKFNLFGKIDVVLNSLNGDFIPYSLDALKEGGRFCEIGKRGIWTKEEVSSRRESLEYWTIALDGMAADEPDRFQELLSKVCNGFEDGFWKPLPIHSFDFVREYKEAFNFLRRGENIGKVVLKTKFCNSSEADRTLLVKDGNVIITGGMGGLGLLAAKVLSQLGAANIFLVSRSGKIAHNGQGLEDDLEWLKLQESRGRAKIHILQCDVSQEESVKVMLNEVRQQVGKIDGIIHGAGVLRDALIRGGGAAAGCEEVWNAKALSAWWLHRYTENDVLRFFVSFSSLTAEFGNVGQSSYELSNRFVDRLMFRRNVCGSTGFSFSVQLPGVIGKGMAASLSSVLRMPFESFVSLVSEVLLGFVAEISCNCLNI